MSTNGGSRRWYNPRMRVVGLTGGICSGKSTVSRIFREEGIPVVDADRIAREIVLPGTPVHGEIVRRFGEGVLRPDGRIDRRKLGAIVFADPEKRSLLESITHPAIAAGIADRLRSLEESGHPIAVVEAALIHEAGRRGTFGTVVAVTCPPHLQEQRLMERDGIGREEARRRVASQLPSADKASRSDRVIDNSGTVEETREQVLSLIRSLRSS